MGTVEETSGSSSSKHLHVRMLGACEFGEQTSSSPKRNALDAARALLAYLLLTAPTVHRREQIVSLLWPGVPVKKSFIYLRQVLKRLRKLLQDLDEEAFFDFNSRTLQCKNHAPINFDVWEFDELYKRAQKSDLFHRQKVHLLRQMLACYQGTLFSKLSFESEPLDKWFEGQRSKRYEQALYAFQTLIEHSARFGNWDETIELAKHHLQLDPWSEQAFGYWMRGLFAQGRAQEAKESYADYTKRLKDSFDLEPPEFLKNMMMDLEHGTFLQRGTSTRVNHIRSRLPRGMTPFFGRERELLKLESILMSGEDTLVTLCGEGGMGKTRLAVAVAKKVRPYFPSGVWFVPLDRIHAPVELEWRRTGSSFYDMKNLDELEEENEQNLKQAQEDLLINAIADALGLQYYTTMPLEMQLIKFLEDKELLLVIDNFEHFANCRDVLARLLDRAPQLTLLVTSREILEIEKENAILLEGLARPRELSTEEIFESASVQLFLECARRSASGLRADEGNALSIAKICELVDGMPLGIELAATLTGEASCNDIVEQLTQNVAQLSSQKHGVAERHRSMKAVFEYSWALLNRRDRWALIQCALFHSGFEEAALTEVTDVTVEELQLLLRKSLLRKDEHGRFLFHPLLEQFAQEKLAYFQQRQLEGSLDSTIDLDGIRRRYAQYYLRFLNENIHAKDSERFIQGVEALKRDYDNIRNAWAWAVDVLDWPSLMESWEGMWMLYLHNGLYREARQLFADTSTSLRNQQQEHTEISATDIQFLLLRCMSFEAHFLVSMGRYEEGQLKNEEIQSLLAYTPDAWLEAHVMLSSGKIALFKGDQAESIRCFESSSQISSEHQFYRLEINALRELTKLYWLKGEHERSIGYGEKAVEVCEAQGEFLLKATSLQYLANTLKNSGQYEVAYRCFQEALEITERFQNIRLQSGCLLSMGIHSWWVGEYSKAQQHLSDAILLSKDYGSGLLTGAISSELGLIYNALGLYEQAEDMFQKSLDFEEKSRYIRGQAYICAFWILPKIAKGELEAAEELGLKAIPFAEQCKDQKALMHAQTHMGHLYTAQKNFEKAKEHYQASLKLHQSSGVSLEMHLEPLVGLAWSAFLQGQQDEAMELLSEHVPLLLEGDLFGVFEPGRIYWSAYQILLAFGAKEAEALLKRGVQVIQERAEQIQHPRQRQSFLENVKWHQSLLQAVA